MAVELIMPQMGESIAEGTVVKWLKKEGDWVGRDEPVVSITTEKVDVEVPAPAAGYLNKIFVQEGETVPVGKVLATIEEKREAAEVETKTESPALRTKAQPEVKVKVLETASQEKDLRRRYSPLVRKIATEEGIKLEELPERGSGLAGRVTKSDVLSFVEERKKETVAQAIAGKEIPSEAPAPPVKAPEKPVEPFALKEGEELIPLTPMRKAIAEHMLRSVRTSPHVTSVIEVDMTEIVRFRTREKDNFLQHEGVELTYLPFVIMAAIVGIKKYPIINSSWSDRGIIIKKYVNIGIAVALEDGLIVPVIKKADGKNIRGLAKESQNLAQRARDKKLMPAEVEGGTFTITNPGVFGSMFGTPIINQPQAAILGTGAIQKRPAVVEGDAIAIRQMMYLSLSFDHRIFDGAMSARYLSVVKHNLENFNFSTL